MLQLSVWQQNEVKVSFKYEPVPSEQICTHEYIVPSFGEETVLK